MKKLMWVGTGMVLAVFLVGCEKKEEVKPMPEPMPMPAEEDAKDVTGKIEQPPRDGAEDTEPTIIEETKIWKAKDEEGFNYQLAIQFHDDKTGVFTLAEVGMEDGVVSEQFRVVNFTMEDEATASFAYTYEVKGVEIEQTGQLTFKGETIELSRYRNTLVFR